MAVITRHSVSGIPTPLPIFAMTGGITDGKSSIRIGGASEHGDSK